MPAEDPEEPDDAGRSAEPGGDEFGGSDGSETGDGDGSGHADRQTPDHTEGSGTEPSSGAGQGSTDRSSPGADRHPADADRSSTETATAPPAGEDRADSRPEPSPEQPAEGEEPMGPVEMVKEVGTSVGMVLLIGALLFALSGVWPPLVAVESGSMEPHMFKGDLVFVSEEGRYAPDTAVAGVVTYQQGRETGYRSFGSYGNVIVYQPNGETGTPVIHRARLYVEAGENWVQRADPQYLGGQQTCAEIVTCPAPHDGFITRGDGNPQYDQVGRTRNGVLSTVVRPDWVRGNAKVRAPTLGCIRLELSGIDCGPLIR